MRYGVSVLEQLHPAIKEELEQLITSVNSFHSACKYVYAVMTLTFLVNQRKCANSSISRSRNLSTVNTANVTTGKEQEHSTHRHFQFHLHNHELKSNVSL